MNEKTNIVSFAHFLYCPFTGLGLKNGYRGDRWLENRIKVFKHFTLPSIINLGRSQTLWISWRPEEKNNPIVQQFMADLDAIKGLSVIHTFHGLCFYDDKYDDFTAKARLMNALEATLPELKMHVELHTHVLMTIQPSDDMFLSGAIEKIQEWAKKNDGVCCWKKGYIMNYGTKEVAEYNTVGLTSDDVS